MVSEKQMIDTALRNLRSFAKSLSTVDRMAAYICIDVLDEALTADEQAEPAILPDDSLSAIISNIGNEIHNLACERQNDEDLSERLSDFRTRLWAIAQQAAIEPAPAARSGAVKAILELVQYHVTDDDDRASLTTAISALEPAEPPESRLRDALEWYAEQARLCRLIHSGGDAGRNALAKDGGAKARAALAQEDGR